MLLVLVLYAAFASVFTVAKVGLAYTTPLFLVGSRMWIAGLAMIGYAWIRGKNPLNISFRGWVLLGALGFFNIYLTNFMEFWSLQYLTTFKTFFIYSLSPFLAAIFSYFLFSESL
ncbi:MAG: DMT family transporter, partial [Chlamydiia bacterium]|nr:DMT family transporter [Chlamydiia bacterium]